MQQHLYTQLTPHFINVNAHNNQSKGQTSNTTAYYYGPLFQPLKLHDLQYLGRQLGSKRVLQKLVTETQVI